MEDEQFTIFSAIEHIRQNIVGVMLFALVFFIIYCVDHINRFNALLYSTPNPIQGVTNAVQNIKKHKKFKK